jgi:hypothetical protein
MSGEVGNQFHKSSRDRKRRQSELAFSFLRRRSELAISFLRRRSEIPSPSSSDTSEAS